MNKYLLFAFSVFLAACSSGPDATEPAQLSGTATGPMAMMRQAVPDQDAPSPAGEGGPPEPSPQPPVPVATNRKIIRNAQVRMRVSDFAASGRTIEQAVRQAGGQIANANETKSANTIENALTVRLPAARLDAFLNAVLKESIFTETKTITAEDVTRRYVDVEARIRSKKATEETYLRLLKQARNVADVLKVEEQLARMREEREVQEAELRQLKDEVALSTVNLTYYQQTEAALRPEEPFYTQIVHNFADGVRLVSNVLIGVFYFLPLGLVGALLVWFVARWRRRRRNAPKSGTGLSPN